MKLLLDANLSPHLAKRLSDLYPETIHVRDLGLERADDRALWEHALEHGFALVSKDSDLHQLSFLYGTPPKVIWIRRGNCTTTELEEVLRFRYHEIIEFIEDPESSFLALR
ncbi:MAG: DUF5615 family PIN-like protein [Gemmatimonadetes bacterium]|nr:DUF5615 family PIN-like protein [Gemmatimonadota bacterium]